MSRPAGVVRAAGCVLHRTDPEHGLQVALVHRSRYGDWSHAKGHVDPGEHPATTAVRETLEETGYAVRLGRRLPSQQYLAKGTPKHVDYWSAEVAPGLAFVPNDEVDEVRWLAPAAAKELLSYPHDAGLVDALMATPQPDATVLLVRHAKAGERRSWAGPDALRPLDAEGLAQAQQLAAVLPAWGSDHVVSAPPTRCVQTVATLGAVHVEDSASDDAQELDPWALVDLVRSLVTPGRTAVVSSQGSTIPASLRVLLTASGLAVPDRVHCRKGSFRVLTFAAGRLVAADYERDAAPVA